MNLSSNLIRNFNDKTNFPHKLLSTDTQVSKIYLAFANGSSANITISKTLVSKMIHSGEFNIVNMINPLRVVSKIVNKQRICLISVT